MTAVIVAVAADSLTTERAASVVESQATTGGDASSSSSSASSSSHAANSNARIEAPVAPELLALATTIGQAWAQEYVRALQQQERDIVGAWPGTIREARRQVLARIRVKLEPEQLDQLARITNLAARRGWETVSEPDLES